MNFDYSDVGNLTLGLAMATGAYLATTGHIPESVLVIAIGGTVKAFLSALDNYKYKRDLEKVAKI
jgi:hypothetical protein